MGGGFQGETNKSRGLQPSGSLAFCGFLAFWRGFPFDLLKVKLLAGDLRAAQKRTTEDMPVEPRFPETTREKGGVYF